MKRIRQINPSLGALIACLAAPITIVAAIAPRTGISLSTLLLADGIVAVVLVLVLVVKYRRGNQAR